MAKLAEHVTTVWGKGRDIQHIKDITTRCPFPANLDMRAPEVNAEVLPALGRFALLKDRKLKAIQNLVV